MTDNPHSAMAITTKHTGQMEISINVPFGKNSVQGTRMWCGAERIETRESKKTRIKYLLWFI